MGSTGTALAILCRIKSILSVNEKIFNRALNSSPMKNHPLRKWLSLAVICSAGIALLVCLAPYDYQWTIYFSTHKAERFANFMNRSIFEGASLPGAGDFVYPLLLIALLLYIPSWLWKYNHRCSNTRFTDSVRKAIEPFAVSYSDIKPLQGTD